MATLKHEKMRQDAHKKMLEDSILEILKLQRQILELLKGKPKPKGGRNA